jgi:hypothetical protein
MTPPTIQREKSAKTSMRRPACTLTRSVVMKFETLMLNSFFAACVLVCVSTLAAMLA